jgi:catechol 2,3-dioxygenase-like lactoylglutathione lyase family enzyme
VEGFISRLLEDFEHGKMTRRQLVQSMALAVVAGPAIAAGHPRALQGAVPPSAAAPWRTVHLDHISYQVTDHVRSAAWYSDLMGWTVKNQAENQTTLAIGDVGEIIIRNRRSPASSGGTGDQVTGVINHISFGIEPWDKDDVKAELTRRGLAPRDDFQDGGFESYHVKDPDGWDLQISNQTEVG